MVQSTVLHAPGQFAAQRDQLVQREGLPFLEQLSRPLVESLCQRANHCWRERVYTPWITLAVFLSQVLADDQSCDAAVERLQKYRTDQGLDLVFTNTTSYCDARRRLPEPIFWDLVRGTGRSIYAQSKHSWLFHGRAVKIVDGTTVTMPDTPTNQDEYPQPKTQRPGVGFPILRLIVVFSLAVGTVLEAATAPYKGKLTGELALLRSILAHFQSGDIVLADRFLGSYWMIAALQARGVDVVARLHQSRKADFRRGRRLGRKDHVVTWTKPVQPPAWMTRAEYDVMPVTLSIREVRVVVRDKTKRARVLDVVTTLRDARTYPAREVGALYRERWHAELDLRALKPQMHMDVLRTKDPETVRKEVAAHLLGYNLVRGLMAEAARVAETKPRDLSFQGARHTIRAFEEARLYEPELIARDMDKLIKLIGSKRVGKRPDRYEPRAVKRRPKPHRLLNQPRAEARRLIAKGKKLYQTL